MATGHVLKMCVCVCRRQEEPFNCWIVFLHMPRTKLEWCTLGGDRYAFWCVPHAIYCHKQMSEAAILANTSGSSRYQRFLSGLGELLRLSSCDPHKVYLGGLDRGGNDGEFTYFYLTDTTQGNLCLNLTPRIQ